MLQRFQLPIGLAQAQRMRRDLRQPGTCLPQPGEIPRNRFKGMNPSPGHRRGGERRPLSIVGPDVKDGGCGADPRQRLEHELLPVGQRIIILIIEALVIIAQIAPDLANQPMSAVAGKKPSDFFAHTGVGA
jgi:hypothetical protein